MKLTLTPPPVKAKATELGLNVVQPTKLRTGEFGRWVKEQEADVALVVAYGRILPADVLAGPRLGCVNVHASLLPKYRGAAPISWAVVHGETESGVTLMVLDEGMDTGDTLAYFRTPVGPNETAGELAEPSPAFELAWQLHAAAFALTLPALGTTFIGAALAAHTSRLTPPWQRLLGVAGGGLLLAAAAASLAIADGSALLFVGLPGLAAWLVWLLATGVRLVRARTADRPDNASTYDEEE